MSSDRDLEIEWLKRASTSDIRRFARDRVLARPIWSLAFALLPIVLIPVLLLVVATPEVLASGSDTPVRQLVCAWCLVVGGATAIGWSFSRAVNREERSALVAAGGSLCLKCGYDLAGLRAGLCPECGERVAQQSGAETRGEPPRRDDSKSDEIGTERRA